MKSNISFELTEKQTELLEDFFGKVRQKTGMIVGQFCEANDGTGFVMVGYLDEEKAIKLQEALGGEAGEMTPGEQVVYTDMG